jgi:hypothetical protein
VIRRRLPAALGLLALLVGMGVGGPGPAQSSGCTPGVSTQVAAAATPGQPVSVATNATVVCPTPEAPSTNIWGPPRSMPQQPQPAGAACTEEVWEPLELMLTPGGQQEVFWVDPSNPGTGSDTPEPQFISRIIGGISAMDFWTQAGTTTDYFMPFTLNGKWDASGLNCIPKDPTNPQGSFQIICGAAPVPLACLRQVNHRIGAGPLPITALQAGAVDIRGKMLQLIHPGTITAVPGPPNSAVVNVPTCFFINGADIGGKDVNQPASFEVVLLGPADADGRQVYYVFRIDVALDGVNWTFGDGDTTTEALPSACTGLSNAPLQFAHRFVQYSPPGGFSVTATENFSLHVTEYWVDADGIPNPPADLGDLPPIAVNPGPAPLFREVVVQEEGVPIG